MRRPLTRGIPGLQHSDIADDTLYCHQRCFRTACEDALAVLKGEPPQYTVQTSDVQSYEGRLE